MTEPASETVYVAVGANIDPERNIERGLALLGRSIPITGIATFYRTPAIDRPEQPDYLNGVIAMQTRLRPLQLRDRLREVEHAMGRVRTADAYAPRTLDLDILLYGDAIISTDALEVPDPDITRRPFLAAGLLELAPGLQLPGADTALAQQLKPGALDDLQQDTSFTRRLQEYLIHES